MLKITIEGENMIYVDSIVPGQAYNIIEMLVRSKARVRGVFIRETPNDKLQNEVCYRDANGGPDE
ncbi:hypothetical protein [Acetonema longum]|uniref:Uncharacterized protein n=1 Tax=Acetonema longum DSM 6540 TaxID=1009370 RepID=F7NKE4_9FIRM|nr:hypothetical protein [Acetonema longum]EGO63585.1 hypothetical protein ALO_12786 [Acetonema longum DSM 6540]